MESVGRRTVRWQWRLLFLLGSWIWLAHDGMSYESSGTRTTATQGRQRRRRRRIATVGSDRIFNGDEAARGRYRYFAQMTLFGKSDGCGGSLIAPHWILTAAHCLDLYDARLDHGWRVGAYCFPSDNDEKEEEDDGRASSCLQSSSDYVDVSTVTTYIHPLYDDVRIIWDYAVIRIDRPITSIPPVELDSGNDLVLTRGTPLVGIGMGHVNNKKDFPSVLQQVQMTYIPIWKCEDEYGKNYFDPSVVCTESPFNGLCQGDSGSPLLYLENDVPLQVGITSFGPPRCGHHGLPDGAARVAHGYSWIRQTVCRASINDSSSLQPSFCANYDLNTTIQYPSPAPTTNDMELTLPPSSTPTREPSHPNTAALTSSPTAWQIPDSFVTPETPAAVQSFYAEMQVDGESGGCGGVVVASQWIVTAAHCLDLSHIRQKRHFWKIGSFCANQTDNCGMPYEVLRTHKKHVYLHPSYNDKQLTWDLAVVRLRHASTLAQPIAMITPPAKNDTTRPPLEPPANTTITGMGMRFRQATQLEHMNVTTISQDECNRLWGLKILTAEFGVLCGLSQTERGICLTGGSPLFYYPSLVKEEKDKRQETKTQSKKKKKKKKKQKQDKEEKEEQGDTVQETTTTAAALSAMPAPLLVGILSFGPRHCRLDPEAPRPDGAARIDLAYPWIRQTICQVQVTQESAAPLPDFCQDFNLETEGCWQDKNSRYVDFTTGKTSKCKNIQKQATALRDIICSPNLGFDAHIKCPVTCETCAPHYPS